METPPLDAWRSMWATHKCPVSAVSSPSCEGKLPLRSLLSRSLREGRQSYGDERARFH